MRARIDGVLSDRLRVGIALSLVASILLLIVWVRLISEPLSMAAETRFIGGPWALSSVIRFGFVVGWAVLVLVGALVLYIKPKQHSLGATIILAFSTLTLLFWASGYIFRGLRGFYWPHWSFLWRTFLTFPGRAVVFLPFDLLAIASVFGIVGGVLGVLWKPKSAMVSVKQLGAKPNLLGVFSAIMAFGSLALPWWVDTNSFYPHIFPWGQDPSTRYAIGWWPDIAASKNDTVMYTALAFILVSGIFGLLGSLVVGKKGRFSLVLAGVSAVLSVATFAMALQPVLATFGGQTIFSVFELDSGYFVYSYLSFGFWVALAAGILAFIASLRHPPTPSETSTY